MPRAPVPPGGFRTLDTARLPGYVGAMSENVDEPRTPPEEPEREETDLSTKLDPDFIPQQGDTPEVQRAREHPEETGS